MTPRVTVLMTVYKGLPYLTQAIESVLSQTFRDFEFLIIDDGSTDGSVACVRSYSDPRIRLIVNGHNLGQTKRLNLGLELARGFYVARQDADDISDSRRLECQLAFLDRHPEIAAVGAQGIRIDADGRVFGSLSMPTSSLELHWKILFGNPLIHGSVVMRRGLAFEEFGGYDVLYSYAADYELWSRVSCRYPLANLPDTLIRYRVHQHSMWESYREERYSEPAAINRRNLRIIMPELTDNEIDVLKVMGHRYRGENFLATYPVGRAVELYFQFCRRFVRDLPASVASANEIAIWQRERDRRSFLSLADACLQQSSRRQALKVLWLLWRHDFQAVNVCGRPLIKTALGRSAVNLLRRSHHFFYSSQRTPV